MARCLRILPLMAIALLVAPAASAPFTPGSPTASRSHRHASGRRVTPASLASVKSRDPLSTAAAIAQRYWGATPCAGQVKIVANSLLAPGLDPSTDAWVTFDSSLGADNLSAPASTYTNCVITLAHWQWATRAQMESDWGMFCLTMIHEMGHLLGHMHSLTAGSVMAPVFTGDASVPAICHASWLTGRRPSGAR